MFSPASVTVEGYYSESAELERSFDLFGHCSMPNDRTGYRPLPQLAT